MIFGPFEPAPLTEDERAYLKFLAATTLLTVLITEGGKVAGSELQGWLQRRRDAKKAAEKGPAS